ECAGTGDWKRSARSADGFFVQLEPDCGACEAHPHESSRPELAPAEFEREKPVFTVISPSSLRVFGPVRISEREDLECGPSSHAAGAEGLRGQAGCGAADCQPDVWGTLVHRFLAYFGKKGVLPSA